MLETQRATFYPRPTTDGGRAARNSEAILGAAGN